MSINEEIYVEHLNSILRNIKTYEEFKELEEKVESGGYAFYGKRNLKSIFHIKHLYENDGIFDNPYAGLESSKNRVTYLYDDGFSKGKAYVKNLYKFFEIR